MWRNSLRAAVSRLPASSTRTHATSAKAALVLAPRSYAELQRQDPSNTPLAKDVRLLGTILGEVMQSRSPQVFEAVERLRLLARSWRDVAGPGHGAFEAMHRSVRDLSVETMHDVARALAHFLALSNAAEAHHRVRRMRALCASRLDDDPDPERAASGALPNRLDSCLGTIAALLEQDGATPEEVLAALAKQHVEIVLTAHPTQVHRRTLLRKHRRVTELLAERDLLDFRPSSTAYEAKQLDKALRREIAGMWGSDKLRRTRPSPLDEAKGGIAVLETSLWDAVPGFLRRLDVVVSASCGKQLPLTMAPVTFASWMGGDRDGNPNVTAPVTRTVVAMQRLQAAKLYLAELDTLRSELSVLECTAELRSLANVNGSGNAEPYRIVLDGLRARMQATVAWASAQLPDQPSALLPVAKTGAKPILDAAELAGPLHTMHASLCACGYENLADGRIIDLIRRLQVFGLQLAPLDLRQESTRHAQAVHALAKLAGVQGYLDWSEATKIEWLTSELNTGRPLLKRGVLERLGELGVEPDVVEVLRTAQLVADLPPGSLGAYVISQATAASDVLAVELLMAEVGSTIPLRVVPLFETLTDLNNAAASLEALFQTPGYAQRSSRRQEIMVGYSDSAKDAGRIAAMWAQFEAQENMLKVGQKYNFELTFFHGKGGTVGRGGNPALYKAVLAHPPGTIDGRFRVTEQGEMIMYNFGDADIAERSLDIFTAAVLRDRFLKRPTPTDDWRAAMNALSAASCDAYRSMVRQEPLFVPYFRTATPEQDLGDLNVGSRPAKRNPKGGVESLRAIPWIFAWSQTRLNLPSWLGVGEAFSGALPAQEGGPPPAISGEQLHAMYEQWPWFRTTVGLIEFLMAKSEVAIAAHYDSELVTDPELAKLGAELRNRFQRAEEAVLAISGHSAPGEEEVLLMRSLRLRNPYIDVLNVIQVEALKRLRRQSNEKEVEGPKQTELALLKDTLLITVNGIATGLRNSG